MIQGVTLSHLWKVVKIFQRKTIYQCSKKKANFLLDKDPLIFMELFVCGMTAKINL